MAGIKINKLYKPTVASATNALNNWSTLVFGVANSGDYETTSFRRYEDFVKKYGKISSETNSGIKSTYKYVQTLLNNGVSVLFKRIDCSKLPNVVNASYTYTYQDTDTGTNTDMFTITAKGDDYAGSAGNNLKVSISYSLIHSAFIDAPIRVCIYDSTSSSEEPIEFKSKNITFDVDVPNPAIGIQIKNFISNISFNNVDFRIFEDSDNVWENIEGTFDDEGSYILLEDVSLTGGTVVYNDLTSALNVLANQDSDLYKDVKLLNAPTYYPQLRFLTAGGLCSNNADNTDDKTIVTQNSVNEALGAFAVKCKSSFRVLIDYDKDMTDIAKVRNFAKTTANSAAIYAYVGFWGKNDIPGSAGFLTAIANAGYNVYSRRLAGTSFTPASEFGAAYKELYIDALESWQEGEVKLNPIINIDAEGNLAIMGSSTLAPVTGTVKDPEQALDVVCVADYVAALLNGIALRSLNVALDRLNLSAITNSMSQTVERFVTSGAITRYDLDIDTSVLGKLGVTCTLYFAIGLEEVELTITSVYDTEITAS